MRRYQTWYSRYQTRYPRYQVLVLPGTNIRETLSRYIISQGGRTGYWLSLLSLAAAGAILNLIPSPHQVGIFIQEMVGLLIK